MPVHEVTSKSFRPCSLKVGISGISAVRFNVAMPMGRMRPALISAFSAGRPEQNICICPDSTSVVATPAPLYGTCTMSMPATVFNSSPHKCGEPPTPDEAKLILRGLAFASAISSLTLFAGRLLVTTIT